MPRDLAVCGYGDIDLARYLGLTTVHVPMGDLGPLDAMEQPGPAAAPMHLPTELCVRAPCGAPSNT